MLTSVLVRDATGLRVHPSPWVPAFPTHAVRHQIANGSLNSTHTP
jgi:hypothetical protein